jgi:thioredoxin-related protein
MKLLIIIAFFLISLVQAEHIRWRASYDKAHQEALKENKLLMVLLVKDNCEPCSKILATTFRDQSYIKKINEKFVSVIVKKGQKQSYPIEMLYTMIYPALFFLNSKELFISENIFGYINPEAFKNHLNLHVELFND